VKYKKPSLQDTMEANANAMRGLCAMAGKDMPKELEAPDRKAPRPYAAPTKSVVKESLPTEHEEQKAFVKWFHQQYPRVLMFAVPNAAMRSPELAAYLKAEGMVKGIPDLIVPEWRLAVEMKRVKGSVISYEQKWMEQYFKRIGWKHFFAFGAEDAKRKMMSIPK